MLRYRNRGVEANEGDVAALDLSKSGGEATCGGPFEKGGREEDEIEKREHKNHLHAMPKIVDAPLPQKFRSMRQFTAGRALHSPCPLLICTGLRNPLRSRLGARTTLPRVPSPLQSSQTVEESCLWPGCGTGDTKGRRAAHRSSRQTMKTKNVRKGHQL